MRGRPAPVTSTLLGTSPPVGLVLCIVLVLTVLVPSVSFGVGTPAGTVISNQATVTFTYGSDPTPRTSSSNVVTITVAQVASVNLAPATARELTGLNSVVNYPFTLVNSGNGTDRFLISWGSSHGLAAIVYVDSDGDQILSPAEIAAGPVTGSPNMVADASLNFVLRVAVPDSMALAGQTDELFLTCTSLFDPSVRAVISRTTTVTAASLGLEVSVSNTTPSAGDRVMYSILYSNAGNAAATAMRFVDVLDPRVRYVTGSASPAPDSVSGQMLRWSNMSVPAWASGYIMFQVEILNNAAPTEIHNSVAGQYMDGQNARTVMSSEQNFMTVQSSGVVTVEFRRDTMASCEPGDTLQYGFLITNNGALPEAFDLSFSSTRGLAWALYADPTGSGRVTPGSQPIANTGDLPGGAQYYVVAAAVVPLVSADQTVDFTTFRAQSTINTANFETVNGSTTIGIPKMSLLKQASVPDPLPGREITYTITYVNRGHGGAYDFAIADPIPANTAYVPGSVTLNGTARTDEDDADEITVSDGILSVNLGTILPNGTGVIEFRVRIL